MLTLKIMQMLIGYDEHELQESNKTKTLIAEHHSERLSAYERDVHRLSSQVCVWVS